MEKETNIEYAENVKDMFNMHVENGDWDKVNDLFLKTQDDGFPQLEVELVAGLDSENLKAYRQYMKTITHDEVDNF
jgi:hypothetical protein